MVYRNTTQRVWPGLKPFKSRQVCGWRLERLRRGKQIERGRVGEGEKWREKVRVRLASPFRPEEVRRKGFGVRRRKKASGR